MLGVEDYGSDNESDNETQVAQPAQRQSPTASLPSPSESSLSLPPFSNAASPSSKLVGGLTLPPPRSKRPKKIAIGLPQLSPEDHKTDEIDGPPAKKPRIEPGARSSGLLSMLPAPKNKASVPAAPGRVLGGGHGPGLVFNTGSTRSTKSVTAEDVPEEDQDDADYASNVPKTSEKLKTTNSLPFLPPSLAKGKANVSLEEKAERPRAVNSSAPAIDFFSLGTSSSSTSFPTTVKAAPPTEPSPFPSRPLIPGISSAPKIEDFVPPEPTPQDPYPGYYMLPSGIWAAYDPEYYREFYDKWQKEYNDHVRALEKGAGKGFEDLETEGAQEVNAISEMERAKKEIQEREERKALTTGGAEVPAAPKMNIKGAALGGRARTRHQLSTLLTEAYQNREALEDQIAQGRRNRKEAGNKYGF